MQAFTQAAQDDGSTHDRDHSELILALMGMTNAVAVSLIMSHDRHDAAYSLVPAITKDLYECASALVPHAKDAYSEIIPPHILDECGDEKLWMLGLVPALYQLSGYDHSGRIPGRKARIFDKGRRFPEEYEAERAEFAQLAEKMLLPFVMYGTQAIEEMIGCSHHLDPEILPEVISLARQQDLLNEPFEYWFLESLSGAFDQSYRYGSLPEQVHRDPDEIYEDGKDYRLLYH